MSAATHLRAEVVNARCCDAFDPCQRCRFITSLYQRLTRKAHA